MRKQRKKTGYALITILVIGLFSIAFLLALASIVTSAVHDISANKWTESLRNAAEIGIDYAVDQYNSIPGGLDPSSASAASSTSLLPSAYLQTAVANTGIPNVQVSITAARLLNTDVSNWGRIQSMSSIYSPQLDPTRTVSTFVAPVSLSAITNAPGGGYRMITSTASNGVISKSIQVILKARFDQPRIPSPLLALSPTTLQQSLFSSPFFSNGALRLNSSALTVQGYNTQIPGLTNPIHYQTLGRQTYAAYDLNLTTNTSAAIALGNTVAGDITIASNSSGGKTVALVPGVPAVNGGNGGTVDGRIISNGVITSNTIAPTTITAPTPATANVLANADTVNNPLPLRQPVNFNNPTVNNASTTQTTTAPVPSSTTAQNVSSLSNVVANNLTLNGTNSVTGDTGNYGFTGLSTDGLSKSVTINNANSPVSLFVSDSGSGQAINLNTQLFTSGNNATFNANGVTRGDPRNLQIYYQGTDAVTLTIGSKNFTGLIYAPNAPVEIKGTGNFNGAVVGGSVKVSLIGQLNLATDLTVASATRPPSGWKAPMAGAPGAFSANNKTSLLYQNGPNGPPILGWQPVTWQEF